LFSSGEQSQRDHECGEPIKGETQLHVPPDTVGSDERSLHEKKQEIEGEGNAVDIVPKGCPLKALQSAENRRSQLICGAVTEGVG
jgi:hypothetical protein